MSEETSTQPSETSHEAPKVKKAPPPAPKRPDYSRKTLRKLGREKRQLRLKTDRDFAKGYFEAKSKRSTDKKAKFRKRHDKAA